MTTTTKEIKTGRNFARASFPNPSSVLPGGFSTFLDAATAGGLARLDWLLRQNPDLVVVELGANDGLRGVDLASIESNLRQIIAKLQAKDLPVLLLGMRLPPNYGADYTEGFQDVYAKIADDTNVRFVPFFLEGVAGDPNLNLPDGIHPTTKGHQLIAGLLKPILTEMVQALDD